VPLQSKLLAFLIENSSNKNSSQLADNKQKRPVLIENIEPNRARIFAPCRAQQIAPPAVAQPRFAALLPGLPAVFSESLPRAFFAKGSVCLNTFLPGSARYVEIDVTYSKQSTDEFLPGSRIARCAFRTLQPVAHLRPSTLNICEAGRFAGAVSPNADRGLRSTCLNASPLHLTNCRLNRLQLFPPAGVCSKRHMQEMPVRADSFSVTHSEASFVVE
jgi:hypothetical protein